jgi:glycyl-tRNA synthetase beta chain
MVFHEKLGSQGERVERLVALAGALVPHVPGAERTRAERAALLAKADLRSGMVGEFPELQGVMGGHYARAQNEPEPVARAIAEQYAPKGPDDRCPNEPESVVWRSPTSSTRSPASSPPTFKPTGSKDPFALRRAALGVIRLVLENGLRLPLRQAFDAALAGYGDRFPSERRAAVPGELLAFFADRLKVHLRAEGARHDLVTAAFAAGEEDDLVRLLARVEALGSFLATDDGRNLLVAYRRASNIVGIEEKRDKRRFEGEPDPAHAPRAGRDRPPRRPAARPRPDRCGVGGEDYAAAMAELASLRPPVDAFFDQVKVNADEPALRVNRLLLLGLIRSALGRVADFGLIEDAGSAAGRAVASPLREST